MALINTGGQVVIEDCIFRNNTDGGILIELHRKAAANVSVNNTQFLNNKCKRGGGLLILYFGQSSKRNTLLFQSCSFEGNQAKYAGGGVCIYVSRSNNNETIRFHNCLWMNNSAKQGQAVHLRQHHGIEFKGCTFKEHHPKIVKSSLSVLEILDSNVAFSEKNQFHDNTGSAIAIKTLLSRLTKLQFSANSSVRFVANKGLSGGALSLSGHVRISIRENSQFLFENNTAENNGGAISLLPQNDNSFPNQEDDCIIQYKGGSQPKNVSIIFRGNYVNTEADENTNKGHSIYGTSLLPCISKCIKNTTETTTIQELFQCIGNFSFLDKNKIQLSTAAHHFASTEDPSDPNCYFRVNTSNKFILHINNSLIQGHTLSDPLYGEPLLFVPGK